MKVAADGTIRISQRLRALVCVILAAALGTPMLSGATSGDARRSPVQLLAVGSPAAAVQANGNGHRFDQAKQRIAPDAPYIPAQVKFPAASGGGLLAAVEPLRAQSACAGASQWARPPPAIQSSNR